MKRFINFLENTNDFAFTLIVSFIAIFSKVFASTITILIADLVNYTSPEFAALENQIVDITMSAFILAVVIAPILETLIGQLVPILGTFSINKDKVSAIVVSAVVFGLFHLPVFMFVPTAIVIGLIFGWAFFLKWKQKSVTRAFIIVTIIHAIHNFTAYGVTYLFPES